MSSYQHLPLSITLSGHPPFHSVGVEMERATQSESMWVFPHPMGSPEGPGKQWLQSFTLCIPSLLLLTATEHLTPESGHSHAFNSRFSVELLLFDHLGLSERVMYKGARENFSLSQCKTPAIHLPSAAEVCRRVHMPPFILATPTSAFSTASILMLSRNSRDGEERQDKAQR